MFDITYFILSFAFALSFLVHDPPVENLCFKWSHSQTEGHRKLQNPWWEMI